jgi:hypothetical protein
VGVEFKLGGRREDLGRMTRSCLHIRDSYNLSFFLAAVFLDLRSVLCYDQFRIHMISGLTKR